MNDRLEELMYEYEKMFGDMFPLMCAKGMRDEEIIAEIERCIGAGEPFAYESGAVY